MDPESLWAEAAASVQSDLDADTAAEAYEVYRVEQARSRLVDRVGDVRIQLDGEVTLSGRLLPAVAVDGHLALDMTGSQGVGGARIALIALDGILTLAGSRAALRPEDGAELPRLAPLLRAAEGERVELLLRNGSRLAGELVATAVDHVEIDDGRGRLAVPLTAALAWFLPPSPGTDGYEG